MPSVCGKLYTNPAVAEDSACSSGEVVVPPKDPSKIAEGLKLLSEGKRNLVCGNLPDASRCLADACDSLSEQCGQFGEECSDAYLSYGKTLLELARMEPGVIGVALEVNNCEEDGATEDDDDESDAKAVEPEAAGGSDIVDAKEPVESQIESPSKLTEEERDTIHELVEGAFEENASFLEQLATAANQKLMGVVNGDGGRCAGGDAAETKDSVEGVSQSAVSSDPLCDPKVESLANGDLSAAEADQPIKSAEADTDQPIKMAGTDTDRPIKLAGTDADQPIKLGGTEKDQPIKLGGTEKDQPIKLAGTETDQPIKSMEVETDQQISSTGVALDQSDLGCESEKCSTKEDSNVDPQNANLAGDLAKKAENVDESGATVEEDALDNTQVDSEDDAVESSTAMRDVESSGAASEIEETVAEESVDAENDNARVDVNVEPKMDVSEPAGEAGKDVDPKTAGKKKSDVVTNGDGCADVDMKEAGGAAVDAPESCEDTAETATSKETQEDVASGEGAAGEDAEEDDEDDENEEETAEEQEPAEVNNLQLAWENIDLARLIYEKGGHELKVADCRMLLAEISMEDEEFARAIEDLDLCLQIRKRLLPADSRLIAESYYQMAVAHSNCENYETSAECYQQCMEVLEKRRELLKKQFDAPEGAATGDDVVAEIEEIEGLLLDLKDRISDANASGVQVAVHGREIDEVAKSPMKNGCATSSTANGFTGAGRQADGAVETDDISHLVRKPIKRKPENESECPEATKKVKAADAEPTTGQTVAPAEAPVAVQAVELIENVVDSSTEKTDISTAKTDADVLMSATKPTVSISEDSSAVGSGSTTDLPADVVMMSETEPTAEPVSMTSNETEVADDVVMVTSAETENPADNVMATSTEVETRAEDVMATSTEVETRAEDVMVTSTEKEALTDGVIVTSTETETPADGVLVTSKDVAPLTDAAVVTPTETESSEAISKEMSDVNEREVGSGDEENKEPKVLDAVVDVESSTGGTEKAACDNAEGAVAVGGEMNGSG